VIDKNWLAVVHCVVGGRIPDGDLEGLCKVLDVEEEVLPYLLITGQAFREWPLAIAGFRQAIRSNPRTGLEMPRGDGSAKTEAMRRELENAIVARMKVGEPDPSADGRIAALRSQFGGSAAEPHAFIRQE
jgi:hypothetical protein